MPLAAGATEEDPVGCAVLAVVVLPFGDGFEVDGFEAGGFEAGDGFGDAAGVEAGAGVATTFSCAVAFVVAKTRRLTRKRYLSVAVMLMCLAI